MALLQGCQLLACRLPPGGTLVYLEAHARLDLLRQGVGDGFVEVADDLHGKLRLDLSVHDEIVERIRERGADAVNTS